MSRNIEAHITYTGIISFYEDSDGDFWVLSPSALSDKCMPHFSWITLSPICTDCSELNEIKANGPRPVYHAAGHMELEGLVDSDLDPFQEWPFSRDNLVPLSNSSADPQPNLLDLTHIKSSQVTPEVALRTKISRGKLNVSCINARRKWSFSHYGAEPPRYLAQVVCHQVRLESDTLGIKFYEGDSVRSVEVRGNVQSPVIVQIGNTMHQDIFPGNDGIEEEIDYHVRLYAKLSRDPDATIGPLISTVVSDVKDPWLLHLHKLGGGIVAQGPNCPPGTWEAGKADD